MSENSFALFSIFDCTKTTPQNAKKLIDAAVYLCHVENFGYNNLIL